MSEFIISSTAYFELSKDGPYGEIIYPDGTRSRKCFTKWQAKQLVYFMRDISLDNAEVKVLIEMIEKSDLPESDSLVENITDQLEEIEIKLASGCRPSL